MGCVCVCMPTCAHPQRAEKGVQASRAGVTGTCELPDLVLGIELPSSARVGSALNYLAISLAQTAIILIIFLYFKITFIYYLHTGA